jgi:hypothetical protein
MGKARCSTQRFLIACDKRLLTAGVIPPRRFFLLPGAQSCLLRPSSSDTPQRSPRRSAITL